MDENQARIFYLLSDEGRKRLLLRGGDGKREQIAYGTPTESDIDLFEIDSDNHVSLDLTRSNCNPHGFSTAYHLEFGEDGPDADDPSTLLWDMVPTWDDLIGFAHAVAARAAKDEEEHDQSMRESEAERQAVAKAFLADPNARAYEVKEKYVTVDGFSFGWGEFASDPVFDEAVARHERDIEERRNVNRRTLANFIENHGSDNQRQRLAAKLLPWQEAYDSLEAHLYLPLKDFPVYQRFTVEEVCRCRFPPDSFEQFCKPTFKSTDATELAAAEWETLAAIKKCVPLATFQLREHRAACLSELSPSVRRGVIVKFDVDNLKFKREFGL